MNLEDKKEDLKFMNSKQRKERRKEEISNLVIWKKERRDLEFMNSKRRKGGRKEGS